MRTQFFSRNVWLGVLMAFVLAFCVQNSADAISRLTRGAGDLETKQPNEQFTISFSVSLQSPTTIPPAAGSTGTYKRDSSITDKTTDGYYYLDEDNDGVKDAGESTTRTYDANHYYDQETINISLTGNARIVRVGSRAVNIAASTTALQMFESTHASYDLPATAEHQKLSGSVTLVLEPTGTVGGVVTVVVTDNSDGGDVRGGVSGKTSPITFTLYSIKHDRDISAPTTVLSTGVDGVDYATYNDDRQIDSYFTFAGGTEQVYVNYAIDGSGSFSIQQGYTDGSPRSVKTASKTFSTSSSAPVFLDMRRGTNKVTASVSGGASKTIIFIYQGRTGDKNPEIEITGGNNKTGATQARLEEPLTVKVTDGNNRPIQGVAVLFESTDPGTPDDDSMFIPVPGTTVYASGTTLTTEITDFNAIPLVNNSVDTKPAETIKGAGTAILVQTDRNGVAQTYFQLSSAIGAHRVTATLQGIADGRLPTPKVFDADAVAAGRSASLVIVSGDNQRSDPTTHDVTDPLVVRVRRPGSYRISDVRVRFTALTGVLDPAPGSTAVAGPGATAILTSGQEIFINTDAHGEAAVTYNAGQIAGAKTVTARVDDEQAATQYDFQIRQVEFAIDGSSAGRSSVDDRDDTPAPVTTTRNLDIDVSGSGNTRTVRVTALLNGVAQTGTFVNLSVSGSGASLSQTSGGTPLTSILTLPATAGTYTLTATTTATGYSAVTEDVEVILPGTLTVSTISPTTGAQQVTVTARRGGSLQEGVNFTISGSGIVPARGVTTAAGSGNAILNFPNIGTYALTVRAEGYTDLPVSVTISTVGQPTTTTTTTPTTTTPTGTPGEADSIEIDGSRSISGTVNQATRLRVRVLDANDRGVSGIRVTFRVLAPGQGRLSQRGNGRAVQAVTDRSGYATASLTPLGGDLIVEAKAAQVSAPVSFIINIDGETRDTSATGDTTSPQTYKVRDEIPISLEGTLTFRGSRTLNGITYTCVGSGECVVSFGTVVKGQIQASPEKTTASQTYKVRDEIPISLEDTLSFTGKHTVNGTIYTCVGSGECVVSFGTVVKGEIRVSAVSTTTPTRTATEINPEVLIGAGQRPPMIWVDSGKIYALVGKDVQEFASGVEGAMNIAVGGGKVYWTERTGESSGTINAANLDGSDVKELASIQAIPMGIAVDPPGSKLYWTNSRGRIQSANLNGSGIQNVIQNLPSPMDITLARGILYWTQYDATESAGSIGIANPTGRGTPKHISTGANMPGSLVIGGGKVYWTKQTGESSGTIHSANLSGNGVNELASIRAVPMGIAVDTARSKLYWTNSRGRIQSAALNGSKIQNVVDGLGMPGDMVLSNSLKAPTAATPTEKASTSTASTSKYDVNGDGTVDSKDSDALIMAVAAGITDTKYDVNGDGKVDVNDIVAVTNNRNGGAAGAPTLLGMKLSALEVDRLQEQIDLLIATNDRSPAAMRTLIYLQQLIVMARPEKTQLLANYPNPFNPETWIPYELATDTNVKLTIYNAQGAVVRVLHLGQQSAGYYTDRERAAYWDGRNALGEQVASGIYFYQLETDDMSSLRKMVILK